MPSATQDNHQYQQDAHNFEQILEALEKILQVAEVFVDEKKLEPLKNFLKDLEKFKSVCAFLASQAKELYKNRHKLSQASAQAYHHLSQRFLAATHHFLQTHNFPSEATDFKKRGLNTSDYLLKVWHNVLTIVSWSCHMFTHAKKELRKVQQQHKGHRLTIRDFQAAEELLNSMSGHELQSLPKNRALSFSGSDNSAQIQPANTKNPKS